MVEERHAFYFGTDAAGTKELGGFYTDNIHSSPTSDAAISISMLAHIARDREHINTNQMRSGQQALLCWGRRWKGSKIMIRIDQRAVAHGLKSRTIRGAPMNILRRCLLLATEYDSDSEQIWIPTTENSLVDALSWFDYDRIADLAKQLIYPTCNLRNRGFLTYSNWDCQQ